jgi:hypothetical protein
MCGIEAETSAHVLWSCDAARAVWGFCEGSIQKSSMTASDFLVFFGYLCDRLDEGELELFAVTTHKIWLRRNSVVFGGPVQSPSYLLKGVTEELNEFQKSIVDSVHLATGGFLSPTQWTIPAEGDVKINWDAALDVQNRLMGIGIIARDSAGRVMAAMSSVVPYIKDPTVAEAIGAKRAVEFGREKGFPSIELEGDALQIVLALSLEECCGAFENVITETKLLLDTYSCWRVGHVGRQGNRAAHLLAKFAVSHKSLHVWVGVCPDFIKDVVSADLVS